MPINHEDLEDRIRALLRKPLIDKKGNHFMLEVESPLLLDHLRSKVQQLGHISDRSFSSSLVKLSADPFRQHHQLVEPIGLTSTEPGVSVILARSGMCTGGRTASTAMSAWMIASPAGPA